MLRTRWILFLAVAVLLFALAGGLVRGAAEKQDNQTDWGCVYDAGMECYKRGDLVRARNELSTFLSNAQPTKSTRIQITRLLGDIADKLLFSKTIADDDPVACAYVVRDGQTLAGVMKQEKLQVPMQLILNINGLADEKAVKPGQTLKLIRGSFSCVINKRSLTMEIWINDVEVGPLFVRRILVGLGKEDRTPAGTFVVYAKRVKPTWTPPQSSELYGRGPISYGEPDYPFGELALWMGIRPTGDTPRTYTGLAIHSTHDQTSIGQRRSLGCIRIADKWIVQLYSIFKEGVSTVTIEE